MDNTIQTNEAEIVIDTEFRDLLPPLDSETYKSLEENIIANGCMFPLVVWKSPHSEAASHSAAALQSAATLQSAASYTLIDGHNRYAICTQHDIPYRIVEKDFNSREDVVIWIIGNQVARRNLTPMQLTYFRGLHYNTAKVRSTNPRGINQYPEVEHKNWSQPQETATAGELSKHYKVARNTIFNDAKTSKAIDAIGNASPEAKSKILSGDVAIDKKELQRLASAPEGEVADVAADIANGTYDKSKYRSAGQVDGISVTDENTPADGGSGDSDINYGQSPQQSPGLQVNAAAAEAYQTFASIAEGSTKAQTKKALRALINELEDIYKRL